MTAHEERDNERFEDQKRHLDEALKAQDKKISVLATKDDLKKLATKEDIRNVVNVYNAFVTAGNIVSKSGGWLSKIIPLVASIIIAIGVISGAWKMMVAWLLSKV